MTSNNKTLNRIASLALCASIAAVGGLATIAPAANAGFHQVSVIDASQTGSLTIHKYEGTPTAVANCDADGTMLDASCFAGMDGIENVTFQLQRVNVQGTNNPVDLSTNDGWNDAAVYGNNNTALAAQNLNSAAPVVVQTDAAGVAVADNLPIGLYYVTETTAPLEYTKIEPFLITLPMTNPETLNTWMYDLHVYPKNASDNIVKSVVDKGVITEAPGDSLPNAEHTVKYTLTSSITDGLTADEMGTYVIHDEFNDDIGNVPVVSVELSDGTDLVLNTHYTLSADGDGFTLTMTTAGLELLAANSNLNVVTTVEAEALYIISSEDGEMTNHAYLIPNQMWADQNPNSDGIDSNSVETIFGHKLVDKVDAQDNSIMLTGAEFTVYADGNSDGVCEAVDITEANALMKSSTTAIDGRYSFEGLQRSDFYNGELQTDLLTYCLVETKAPAGYNINAEPIAFTVGVSEIDLINPGTLAVQGLVVNNQKSNLGNSLPLTGGEGAGGIAAGLGILAALGGGYYFVAAKRRKEEEDEVTTVS